MRRPSSRPAKRPRPLHYEGINRAAVAALPKLLRFWLPDGKIVGREYVARNPRRDDRHRGSFSINLDTGAWGDFAIADAKEATWSACSRICAA